MENIAVTLVHQESLPQEHSYPRNCLISSTENSPIPDSLFLTIPVSCKAMELGNVAISQIALNIISLKAGPMCNLY